MLLGYARVSEGDVLETRPYMRARVGFATTLLKLGNELERQSGQLVGETVLCAASPLRSPVSN
jgi:hypothetical protein